MIKVEQIVKSLSKEEEESNGSRKKRRLNDQEQRNSDFDISSGTDELDSFSGNVTKSEDDMHFDITSDGLRASYSNKSRSTLSRVEEKTKKTGRSKSCDVSVKGPTLKDLSGLKNVVDDVNSYVIRPFLFPNTVQGLGMKPLSGLLLHGPPGCGKTTLAYAIGNEARVPFYMLSASELVSGVSEENIRELFSKAYRNAPSITFIDEIDAIGAKRENQHKGMDTRMLTQLLNCMDPKYMRMKQNESTDESVSKHDHVVVIGATNRPDSLDLALRRRFNKEMYIGVPDEKARAEILSLLTRDLSLESNFNIAKIVRMTSGFVGSDFENLVMEACTVAFNRIVDSRKTDFDSLSVEERKKNFHTTLDFEEGLKKVQPCLTKEGFSTRPHVKSDDVGGLDHLKEKLYHQVIRPLKFPEEYKGVESCLENGFLLYGPPGCGKSLLAQAVANEARANFIHVKGPELLSKYVGETENAIRELFRRARMSAPCIIFFDEVDALTTKRGEQGAWVVERPLNQLLVELSGGEQRDGVIVIGATNRPDMMDPAIRRAGRFGTHFHVPLPNSAQRYSILKSLVKKFSIDPSVDFNIIANRCENFNGADLNSLVNRAVLAPIKDPNSTSRIVKMVHFEQALTDLKTSAQEQG